MLTTLVRDYNISKLSVEQEGREREEKERERESLEFISEH